MHRKHIFIYLHDWLHNNALNTEMKLMNESHTKNWVLINIMRDVIFFLKPITVLTELPTLRAFK